MKTIPLTKGYEAMVDDADYEMLSQWKWMASICDGKVYATRFVWLKPKSKVIYMHRLLMGFPAGKVDHENRNSLDNQRLNLRTCTNAQNSMNSKCKAKKRNYYFRGVFRQPGRKKWSCAVALGGKSFFGGVFFNPVAAAVARDRLAIKIHGKFAALNFQTHIPLQVVN